MNSEITKSITTTTYKAISFTSEIEFWLEAGTHCLPVSSLHPSWQKSKNHLRYIQPHVPQWISNYSFFLVRSSGGKYLSELASLVERNPPRFGKSAPGDRSILFWFLKWFDWEGIQKVKTKISGKLNCRLFFSFYFANRVCAFPFRRILEMLWTTKTQWRSAWQWKAWGRSSSCSSRGWWGARSQCIWNLWLFRSTQTHWSHLSSQVLPKRTWF